MLTYPMYAALFDFRAPYPQTKILIFQGTLKVNSNGSTSGQGLPHLPVRSTLYSDRHWPVYELFTSRPSISQSA